jgi:hypothetical protein
VGPALTGLTGAQGVTKAAYEISGILDSSRAFAVANHTYVFVGFTEVDVSKSDSTDPQLSGTGRLVVGSVASKNGSRMFDVYDPTRWQTEYTSGVNKNGLNLVSVVNVQRYDNVHMIQTPGKTPAIPYPLTGQMARYDMTSPTDYTRYIVGCKNFVSATAFTWPLGKPMSGSGTDQVTGGKYNFSKVLTFDPQGMPHLQWTSRLENAGWYEIDLQLTHGNFAPTPPTNANVGNHMAIMINGLTGGNRVLRP